MTESANQSGSECGTRWAAKGRVWIDSSCAWVLATFGQDKISGVASGKETIKCPTSQSCQCRRQLKLMTIQ